MKKRVIALIAIVAVLGFIWFAPIGDKVNGVFTSTTVKQVRVISQTLNLRSGAGTTHSIVASLPKGKVVDVLGKIGSWYVIKTAEDKVGCVYSTYVAPYVPTTTPPTTTPPTDTTSQSAMQTEMLGYINASRAENGLPPLVLDKALSDGAYLKSKDMIDNNYFDHNSPTYGSPFDMMHNLGITYMTAGENLAKYDTIKGAHQGLMNSPGHRANLLNPNFNKIGLGIIKSGYYYYITQWFTN